MSSAVNFAIIGASGIAPAHISAIKKCGLTNVTHIYSRNNDLAESIALKFGLTAVTDYQQILNNASINAVDIVTEPHRHGELAIKAISSGKHVLIEKPIESEISTAEQVLKCAQKSQSICSVISQKRYDPKILKMKNKYLEGCLGDPLLAEIKLFSPRSDEYYTAGTGWRGEYGSVLLNQAYHWLDIALWFFGDPVEIYSITSRTKKNNDCSDNAAVSLKFKNGLILNVLCSTSTEYKIQDEFTIYGTKNCISYNDIKDNVLKRFFPSNPFYPQIQDFAESIIHNRPVRVPLEDALNVLKLIKRLDHPS